MKLMKTLTVLIAITISVACTPKSSVNNIINATKANASTAIKFNDDYFIIDCGDGSSANLSASNFDYANLKGIFFTHHHFIRCPWCRRTKK